MMISMIKEHIKKKIESWPLGNSCEDVELLSPLFRFNKEANQITKRDQIGNIILWFSEENNKPLFVTKTQGANLSILEIQELNRCYEQINKEYGKFYPKVFDIATIDDQILICMEAIQEKSYEIELSSALFGPDGNLETLTDCANRHFLEMSNLFKKFSTINENYSRSDWGDWAFKKGIELREEFDFNCKGLTDQVLLEIQNEISQINLKTHHVMLDHHCANIFPGPLIIDQFDSTYHRRQSEPGIFDPIRFLIAYLRASPLNSIYRNWYAILGCILNDEHNNLRLSFGIRNFLESLGLLKLSKSKLWALFTTGFIIRIIDELRFHKESENYQKIKNELNFSLDELIHLKELYISGCEKTLNETKNNETNFAFPSTKKNNSSNRLTDLPILIKEGYKAFNIVSFKNAYFGLSQSIGNFDLLNVSEKRIEEEKNAGRIFVQPSCDMLMKDIDCWSDVHASKHEE